MSAFVISREGAPGRERGIELLVEQHLEGCRLSRSRIAVVSGPAGIGKSALLSALRRELQGRGTRLFEGQARRRSVRAHGLFTSLTLDLLALAEEQGTPARALGELSRRLAPLTGRPAHPPGPGEARLELADALAELVLLGLSEGAAVLLHDVDAADADSLHLLGYLLDALAVPDTRSGGLVVLSHRDGALPEALEAQLSRCRSLRLALGGLSVEGVRTFLGTREVAERLFNLTAGEPGRLQEMLVSHPPQDLAARRLEKLQPEERRLLLCSAVLGEPRPAAIFGRMLGQGALPLLDRLAQGRFLSLSVEAGQPLYALSRESDRAALLASAADQAELHAAAGEALAATGAPPEEVARHFLACEPRGRGAAWALRAARALSARCAHEDAVALYRAALAGGQESQVHQEMAAALEAVGDARGALKHLGLARRGATPRQMQLLRARTASLCVQIGKLRQAEKLCHQALCGATDLEGADEAQVRSFINLCEVRLLQGDYPGVREACDRGLSSSGLSPAAGLALRNVLGKALLALGAYDEARACFEANEAEAFRLSLPRELMLARINVGVTAHRTGDRRTALSRYRAALEVAPQDRALAALAAGNLGALHHEAGEIPQAAEQYAAALAASTRAMRPKGVSHWAANSARLALFLGETERGLSLAEHALGVGRTLGDPYLVAQATLVRGEALEARGELTAAVAELQAAGKAFAALGNPRYTAESGIALSRVLLARGDVGGASAALARVEESEAPRSSAALAAEVALQAAEVALAVGQVAEADRQAEKARSILLAGPGGVGGDTDLEGPFRTYRILSRVRAAQGDASGAAAELLRAVRLLEDLAARVPEASRQRFLSVPGRAQALAAAAEREMTPERARRARGLEEDPLDMPSLVGNAPALQKLTRLIAPVGRSMATVLIRGESGTGKELVAEAIHRASPRRDRPLVTVNCAAMHEELLLSELFGHEKGAFTGAVRERKGRFELADGGTIFLDEIGEVSPKAQVALLRVLQERELERVGGSRTIPVDVRVIGATNRNLEQMIAEGKFRQDLYYRLKGVMLELPPLRERREDIPLLAAHFLGRVAAQRGEPARRFSEEALDLLCSYPWPGNVRELENVVGAVSIFAPGEVVGMEALELHGEFLQAARGLPVAGGESNVPAGEIDFYVLARDRGIGLKELRHQLELQMIGRALREARGNISEAARLLQMKRSRLSQIVNAEPSMRAIARGSAA